MRAQREADGERPAAWQRRRGTERDAESLPEDDTSLWLTAVTFSIHWMCH